MEAEELTDDALRVRADALVEKGDPLGELIQLQLLDEPTLKQRGRAAELMAAYSTRLAGLGVDRVEMNRGRIEQIGLRMQAFLDRGDAILDAAPDVQWIELHHASGDRTQSLSVMPALARVRRLRIQSNVAADPVGSKGAKALGSSRFVAKLRALDLSGTQLGPVGARDLFKGDFPALEELALADNPRIGAAGVKAIARARLPRLRRLDLGSCRLRSVDGLRPLLDRIEDLDVGQNGLESIPLLPKLRRLVVVGDPVAHSVMELARAGQLRELTAYDVGLTAEERSELKKLVPKLSAR